MILAFAGGIPALGQETVVHSPPLDEKWKPKLPYDRKQWTRDALYLVESFYFGDGGRTALRTACRVLKGPGPVEARVSRVFRMLEVLIGEHVDVEES